MSNETSWNLESRQRLQKMADDLRQGKTPVTPNSLLSRLSIADIESIINREEQRQQEINEQVAREKRIINDLRAAAQQRKEEAAKAAAAAQKQREAQYEIDLKTRCRNRYGSIPERDFERLYTTRLRDEQLIFEANESRIRQRREFAEMWAAVNAQADAQYERNEQARADEIMREVTHDEYQVGM